MCSSDLTLLAGFGGLEGEASSNSLDETVSAELLIEIGSQDSIHIIASSDEAALTMIAEFQQIRTQAALIQTPESGAESAIDLQIQFPNDVLIIADPYDTWDHWQDGFIVLPLEKFFYEWNDFNIEKCYQEKNSKELKYVNT